ncbi:MAG TPA: endolytic transglycosylase MltG [Candidatus Moranbacteria bacterium]|nr:endolytic transglycosylase MltG [Candidatus Moranbacteria bacterium]
MNKKNKIIIISIIFLLILAGLFYFRAQVYYSQGNSSASQSFEIKKGEGNAEIAERLKAENLISGKIYFYYYLRSHGFQNKIMPGVYSLSGNMKIPEIVSVIINSESQFIKITFPEGFTMKQMAEKLNSNGLSGDEFLKIANTPGELKKRYSYLTPDSVKTLEGYLFPDTYFFKKDISAENIVGRMLDTFDGKLNDQMQKDILKQNKSINDVIIMASIVEREVQTLEDMKIASGIFWKRIASGQRLQSDAPLSYILGDTNDQHSGKDLELNSPYNTYRFSGLPPAPISNPGINAINSAIYPENSNYNFFLTASVNGEKKVIYSKTFQEHVANKQKYGL